MNKVIESIPVQDYESVLKNCPGNSTIIYNQKKIGKVQIPDIKKRNDYVMWLQIIKKEKYLYGMNEVLASHRVRKGALSRNKVSLVKYQWHVYRNIEKLSAVKSASLVIYQIKKSSLR